MRAVAAGLSDVGRERTHNEDRFLLLPEYSVFVVADGMGGHHAGEVASRLAASAIAGHFRLTPRGERPAGGALGERLLESLVAANDKIFSRGEDRRARRGMGTTVVAAAFCGQTGRMFVAHAGDSRCYLLRGEAMTQLTRDHSLIADALLERPDLTESDLAYLPKNVITRALGIQSVVDPGFLTVDAEPGDLFLLCSDGLHGLVEDAEMARLVRGTPSLVEACSALVDRANRNGGKDNITAVLIRIEAGDGPWK